MKDWLKLFKKQVNFGSFFSSWQKTEGLFSEKGKIKDLWKENTRQFEDRGIVLET